MRAAPRRSRGLRPVRATALLVLSSAGCAPHLVQVPEFAPGEHAARYRALLAGREARARAVDAELLLWPESPAGRRLPGAEARLLLAAPDAFRLRVGSLFGTALDLGARGDSLAAYVPSRRTGLNLDAARDSLGLLAPGGLVVRALAAAWRPPERAWAAATREDSLLRVWWMEGEDTLALTVGTNGLPVRVRLARPGSGVLEFAYQAWHHAGGAAWPSRWTLADAEGAFRLAAKVSRVRFLARPDSLRLAVHIPPGATQLTLSGLRRALERLGSL